MGQKFVRMDWLGCMVRANHNDGRREDRPLGDERAVASTTMCVSGSSGLVKRTRVLLLRLYGCIYFSILAVTMTK